MIISAYEAICNLGNNIENIYQNAINGNTGYFEISTDFIKNTPVRVGMINSPLPEIKSFEFNLRCNRLILKTLEPLKKKISEIKTAYKKSKIAIIVATTNSGVEEYERTKDYRHSELVNPALFLKQELELNGFYITVSTACSSGLKAFSLARNILENKFSDVAIVACVDTLAKVPIFGFNSLEVLSASPSLPFSRNRNGMNIGEACSVFILEQKSPKGINILGIGESSDIYHPTTPDPKGKEAINAIKNALSDANLTPEAIDYINVHGTGTIANDIMEANAIYEIFKDIVPSSSTKPYTGHCLGAAAGIETALCCKLIENFNGRLFPNIFDGEFDDKLPPINLVKPNSTYKQCNICMCNSFGFGGSNAIMILGKTK